MLHGEYGTSKPDGGNQPHVTEASPASDNLAIALPDDPFVTEAADLQALGFSKPLIANLYKRARQNGSCLEDELLSEPFVSEALYYEALARHLHLPFRDRIKPGEIFDAEHLDSQLLSPRQARLHRANAQPALLIVPKAGRLKPVQQMLNRDPATRTVLIVTTPATLKQAIWKVGEMRRVRKAIEELATRYPAFSAKQVVWGQQGFVFGLILSVLCGSLWLAPKPTVMLLHILFSGVYFSSLAIRMLAIVTRHHVPKIPKPPSGPKPVYSVLVALYREKDMAGQLVAALKKLHWPKSRLEIKLICETGDQETLSALRAQNLDHRFEIVEVPAAFPMTKPKALAYALPALKGEFVVIYDAEDRPHPDQLREAHAAFLAGTPKLACLQSPLKIANSRQTWISSLFAMEYAGLFQTILPALARFRLPLPLGGTSNHFRLSALRESCGWDPYNVTEDADLGIRLSPDGVLL